MRAHARDGVDTTTTKTVVLEEGMKARSLPLQDTRMIDKRLLLSSNEDGEDRHTAGKV